MRQERFIYGDQGNATEWVFEQYFSFRNKKKCLIPLNNVYLIFNDRQAKDVSYHDSPVPAVGQPYPPLQSQKTGKRFALVIMH